MYAVPNVCVKATYRIEYLESVGHLAMSSDVITQG